MPAAHQIDIHHVAKLARLTLTEDEALRYAAQLDGILTYIDTLTQHDLGAAEPTAHAMPVYDVLRADVSAPGLHAGAGAVQCPETLGRPVSNPQSDRVTPSFSLHTATCLPPPRSPRFASSSSPVRSRRVTSFSTSPRRSNPATPASEPTFPGTSKRRWQKRTKPTPPARSAAFPIAIKDNINVTGQPCTCGSRILSAKITPLLMMRARFNGCVPVVPSRLAA
jgi:aspartyl-tRNA(Asn)/glutamyl-tRNA(Gln) amidotransferase subunit C